MSIVKQLFNEYIQPDYSPADVLSRVSAAEKQIQKTDNTAKFGLQDSNGDVVLVYVDKQQAEEFEKAMSQALADMDEQNEKEIAEVLHDLHDKFNIINIEWPQVQEDEEETETDPVEGEGEMGGEEMPTDGEEMPADGEEGMDDASMDPAVGGDGSQETIDQVMQMMAADAEAKRQEAIARAAEARAREAEATAKIVDSKLRSEEEVADMEAYYDAKGQEQKEAKKLAKLAKYRHDMKAQDMEQDAMDYSDALAAQEQDSTQQFGSEDMEGAGDEGMDDVGLEDAIAADGEPDAPTLDTDQENDDFGVENEEAEVDPMPELVGKYREIESVLKKLYMARKQR